MGQNTTWAYEDCARSTVIRDDRTRHLRWSGVVPRARPAAPLGTAPVILRWSGGLWLVQPPPPGPRPLPCGGQDWYMPSGMCWYIYIDAMCVLLTTPVVLKSPSS